jgi:hypothetical protein
MAFAFVFRVAFPLQAPIAAALLNNRAGVNAAIGIALLPFFGKNGFGTGLVREAEGGKGAAVGNQIKRTNAIAALRGYARCSSIRKITIAASRRRKSASSGIGAVAEK